ncbi:hypothetical protein Droror1_Dr00020755 [Drosera rotundifolia]
MDTACQPLLATANFSNKHSTSGGGTRAPGFSSFRPPNSGSPVLHKPSGATAAVTPLKATPQGGGGERLLQARGEFHSSKRQMAATLPGAQRTAPAAATGGERVQA